MSKGALIRPFVITVHCVCIMKLFLYDECKELLLMKSAGKPCQLHLWLSEIKLGSSPVEMLHKCTSCKWMPLKAEVVSQHLIYFPESIWTRDPGQWHKSNMYCRWRLGKCSLYSLPHLEMKHLLAKFNRGAFWTTFLPFQWCSLMAFTLM